MPIPRIRKYNGPALFSYGFRPFFLFASAYTALSILMWLPFFFGELEVATAFSPVDWHIHEWLFGFLPAVITGFLFTAVPNWTGRMPLQGWPLAFLLAVWIAGRITVSFSALIGWRVAAAVDLAFLVLVTLVIAREIIAGQNWRNLKVLIPVSVLLLANALFHYEAVVIGGSDYSRRLGIAAAIILIVLIGGRIIPSFTRNWLARENPGRLPASFGMVDKLSIILTITGLISWVFLPENRLSGVFLLTASLAQLFRLARWAGDRTLRDPLVWILHASYFFVPLGLLLLGVGIFYPQNFPVQAGMHALGIGAIGGMTLSVMVRASLGHTGRALKASPMAVVIFISILTSALARILQAMSIGDYTLMMHFAGLGWLIAFGGFSILFAPVLMKPRKA